MRTMQCSFLFTHGVFTHIQCLVHRYLYHGRGCDCICCLGGSKGTLKVNFMKALHDHALRRTRPTDQPCISVSRGPGC